MLWSDEKTKIEIIYGDPRKLLGSKMQEKQLPFSQILVLLQALGEKSL